MTSYKRYLDLVLRAVLPVLLAVLLMIAGVFCARLFLDSQGGPAAKEILVQTGREIRTANQILFEQKTYQIVYDYFVAFLDSAIAFDFVPNFNIGGLISLVQHTPAEIEIRQILFTHDYICLEINATSAQQLLVFQEYLTNCEHYSSIYFDPNSDSDLPYAGSFYCHF